MIGRLILYVARRLAVLVVTMILAYVVQQVTAREAAAGRHDGVRHPDVCRQERARA